MSVQEIVCTNRSDRVETGAVRFTYNTTEADWPGFFIRGDDAYVLACAIQDALGEGSPLEVIQTAARLVLLSYALEIQEDVVVQPKKEPADERA